MKDKQLTFIIISPGFAIDEKDSTCLPLQQNLIKAINRNFPGIKIIILALRYPSIQSEYDWYGNKVITFGRRNKGKISTFFLWRKVWLCLKKLNKENNIKGLLSFWMGECALLGNRFGKRYDINHYCWVLGQDAKKENKHAWRMQSNQQELVALSDFIVEELYKNHSIIPGHIIPPGIDAAEFSKKIVERDIDVMGAGSLISLKQYELFINIVFRLKEIFPGIKATLCGKGPEEENLKNLISFFKLEDTISLAGERPHAEVMEMMQRTKVFIHPSSYEGFGVVCIEALYAGAQVISFCKPMNEEIQRWHIVKEENEMLQKAIELLHKADIDNMPVMIFSMDDCAKKMMHLFGYNKASFLKSSAHASNY
jgi:glycosyltransferase involved in cell wall biosynthesis